MAQGCCGCCSALRPRYKRLVDNIFPASPQEGLVKSNMEKLTFYSLSSPEKLDRIGEYLFQKASRDIYRRRHGFVIIAMEAMDQLLVACHSQTLNLFVESFLKMVQKLLESTDPQLQTLATQSFVRFANIEEDTPSYHRRYDFFVSKFSAMCHSNHVDKVARDKIRLAGIQGLQGVIRKTVSDDLVENIWEAQHMDKIVPSLLYNMQTAEKYETVSCLETDTRDGAEEDPPRLAEACLRELVGRASFGHIRSVLRPVLTHFDRHELWIPNDFAVHVFKIIMFSIQAQYSYSVVEALMQHLDAGGADPRANTRVRAARASVLSNIVAFAAGDSVGPSVLEIINNLLTNLRASVARDSEKETDEKLYQEALINALGEFADHLPDFQKIDIMMFIVNKVPSGQRGGKGTRPDSMLQSILLKSLLKVGTTYKTTELTKAFPAAFLEALLRLSSAAEPATRLLLQRILHTLLDRRGNAPHLATPTVEYEELGLAVEKCSRQDLIFISKHGYAIFSSLYDGLQLESNTTENIAAIYTTVALLCIELASEETVCDILQLILAIQQSGVSNPVLSVAQQCQLAAASLALAALLPRVLPLPRLADYLRQLVQARAEEAAHLLPPLRAQYPALPPAALPAKLPYLLMDQLAVCEYVRAGGVEAARLAAPPYAAPGAAPPPRHSWLEAGQCSPPLPPAAGGVEAARLAAPPYAAPGAAPPPRHSWLEAGQCSPPLPPAAGGVEAARLAAPPYAAPGAAPPPRHSWLEAGQCSPPLPPAAGGVEAARLAAPPYAAPGAAPPPRHSWLEAGQCSPPLPPAAGGVEAARLAAPPYAAPGAAPPPRHSWLEAGQCSPPLPPAAGGVEAARLAAPPYAAPGAAPPPRHSWLEAGQCSPPLPPAAGGVEAARLAAPPYAAPGAAPPPRHSWLEAGAAQGRDSLADIAAPGAELDSADSSPGVQRQTQYDGLDEEYRMFIEKYNHNHRPTMQNFGTYHPLQAESVSLEALRRAAGGPSEAELREAERRRATLNSAFRTAPFDHLLHITQPKYEIKDKLEEIFNSITEEPLLPVSGSCSPAGQTKSYQQNVPPYTKYFPELFLY